VGAVAVGNNVGYASLIKMSSPESETVVGLPVGRAVVLGAEVPPSLGGISPVG